MKIPRKNRGISYICNMKTFFNKLDINTVKFLMKYNNYDYDSLFNLIKLNKTKLTEDEIIRVIKKYKNELLLNEEKLFYFFKFNNEMLIELQDYVGYVGYDGAVHYIYRSNNLEYKFKYDMKRYIITTKFIRNFSSSDKEYKKK